VLEMLKGEPELTLTLAGHAQAVSGPDF